MAKIDRQLDQVYGEERVVIRWPANAEVDLNEIRDHLIRQIDDHVQRVPQDLRAVETHEYPDHHSFVADDIAFADGHAVLITEKDAVKCRYFAGDDVWYVPAEVDMQEAFRARLDELLEQRAPPGSARQAASPKLSGD